MFENEIINNQNIESEQEKEMATLQEYLLNLSNEAIFAWNLNGIIIYWNTGAEKMYGYSSEEAIGSDCHDLLKTVYPSEISDIKLVLERCKFWNGEIENTCKDGRKILCETRQQLIKTELGNQIVSETNRDITELKNQQELLLKAEITKNEVLNKTIEMKDEFLSLITHELKTPLAVIISAIQAMDIVCGNEMPDKAKGYLNKIHQNTNRQLKLVNNLLDNTRLNAGHFKINKKNIDIVRLTKLITEATKVFADQKDINLIFVSTMKEKVIGIDDEHYEKILLNLLSNAIKFTPKGKSISVKVSQKTVKGKIKVCIKVSDEGIGIPSDKKDLIFEKFGQVDSSLSRKAEGTGIGLTIVKMLVEKHDGEITLNSKEGVGSTFTIILPETKASEPLKEQVIPEKSEDRIIKTASVEFSDIYLKQ